jgi:ABC-type bacteriocin/lantibiotic exporter with double-glycine peptidase domain
MKNIGFRYNKKWILKDLSLDLRKNTTTVLRGSVGSGKTTLLKILLGLLEMDEGEMIIHSDTGDDQHFLPSNSRQWRKNFTYMSQEATLFDRSLYENLIYGHSITRQECMDLLKEYGYVPLLVKTLQDLDRQVGRDGFNLSGGQRKLVILFRCLLSSCSSSSIKKTMIVMDEPTSNLDAQTHGLVLHLIESLSKKETMLIISHDNMLFKKYPTVDIGLLNCKNCKKKNI